MGNAKVKGGRGHKSTYISPKSLLYVNDDFTPAYSTFYHFTRWITNFVFFTEISDNDEVTRLVVMKDGPNDYNIYQIIKAIDEMEPKNIINEFSFCDYFNMNSEEEAEAEMEAMKGRGPSPCKKTSTMCVIQNDFKGKVFELIETVYVASRRKFDKVLMKGPPNNLRWFMWLCLAKERYKAVQQETGFTNEQLYAIILKDKLKKDIETKILQNLQQGLQCISYYYESDKVNHLHNLLRAIALYDKEIGFNLIINQIAAFVLILSNFDEAEAFLLIRFMLSPEYGLGLKELILDDRPKRLLFDYVMRVFIEERMPNVHEVIKEFEVQNKLWFSQWAQSLFIDKMPFSVCIRIWDCLFVKEIPFFYNFILGLIKHFEAELVTAKSDVDFISKFDTRAHLGSDDDVVLFREKLISLSEGFTITPQMIQEVEERFYASSQTSAIDIKQKQSKELKAIMRFISQNRLREKQGMNEKDDEVDPDDLSLDDLEVNEEGTLGNRSSTDDEIANIEIRAEYINREDQYKDSESKNRQVKQEKKKMMPKYSQKEKCIVDIQYHKKIFDSIAEEKDDPDRGSHGIKKDETLSDFSLEGL